MRVPQRPGPRSPGHQPGGPLLGLILTALFVAGCALTSPWPPGADPAGTPGPAAGPPFQANCAAAPGTCGYPDAGNTGVGDGVPLTRVPQDATEGEGWFWRPDVGAVVTTGPGAELSGLQIDDGMILVFHRDVRINNVRLATHDHFPINCAWGGDTRTANSCLGLVVEDTEIVGLSIECHTGMGFSGYTARRVAISRCQDGFKANRDVLIEDSFVTDLWYEADETGSTHNDGVQTTGGAGVTLRHNTFLLGADGVNAVVQFGIEDYPTISGWVIEDNLLDGGGLTFNARPPVTGTVVRDNRFTDHNTIAVGDLPDATWQGNYWDATGEPLPQNA